MSRIWKYKETAVKNLTPDLVAAADDIPILAKLLAVRGITDPQEAKAFINLVDYQPTPGSAFPDMEKAVQRLSEAIEKQEHILVFGDFDVDGITGTSVLMQCLKSLNANVSFYIPDRHTEGHGLNSAALCRLVSARRAKVVVSTDTGITNFNEVNLLTGLNVDTIITDHHELPENLPQAYAILNPKLLPESSPIAHLAGVGVAFKLSEALLEAHGKPQSDIDSLLDLVAVGTVVDMVPLVRENRYLVWRGLQILQRRERLGLRALLLEANVNETAPIDSQTLGFSIGPRLNAIGRLAGAGEGVELMISTDEEQARQLAAKLEQLNRRRKELVEQCLLQAETHLISSGELSGQKAIILCSKDWNAGVVGLVATKLIDKYNRPCFMGYMDEETQEVRFSARSIEGFNMHENLQALEDLFIRWGGHAGAAGFSIAQKDLQRLKARLFQLCAERITDEMMVPVTWVDMQLVPSQVNTHLVDIINRMAPFGQSNPLPIFGLEKISIGAQRTMGEDQRHLKLVLTNKEPGHYLEAIHWNWGTDRPKLNPTNTYRFAFTAEVNSYNGVSKVQLLLKDFQDESKQSLPSPQTVVTAPGASPAVSIPKTVPNRPATAEVPVSAGGGDILQWIDQRGRDEQESFLNQILTTLSEEPNAKAYHLFCEGTQQCLPFPLPESLVCGRNDGTPEALSQNMILWDLPPDMPSLIQLIQTQQPRIMHLVGGKYEKIPLCRPPQEFLEGFLKVLHRLSMNNRTQPLVLSLSKLSGMLSTTQQVVVLGLSLLSRTDLLGVTVLSDRDNVEITLLQSAVPLAEQSITDKIEYMAFRNALQEVHQFREWLMVAPATVIQSAVALEVTSGSSILKEERERHAIDIR